MKLWKMIEINIQGIGDGKREIEIIEPVSKIEGIYPEFFDNVEINGELRKIGNRYSFRGEVECKARLVCDRSLKEFDELISNEIKLSFLADTNLFLLNENKSNESNEIIIHEEAKSVDITEDIKDLLSLALPMKRIAPDLRDKEIEDLYPEKHIKNDDEIDDRWAPLKNINLDKN